MNANELRPLLVEYRSQVERAWTAETAHPDFAASVGLPHGQCGATSAWLQRQLWLQHGIKTHFTIGVLYGRFGARASHCWLETFGYELVLDLTADQLPAGPAVVCDDPARMRHLIYVADEYLQSLVDQTDLLHRTALLSEAVKV